jgi:two-component system chemotaxis response regulator CheY
MPRVLSVGQCGLDHGKISRHFRQAFKAEVAGAETFEDAIDALRGGEFALVLVNRVTDADGSSGLELIRSLQADPEFSTVPVMLVSNYADAQQNAQALGAMPGFGKSELALPHVQERIKTVLNGDQG